MSSILTNTGAMTALQTMKSINRDLGTVQNQISTGKKVASASDAPAVWAISKVMEADIAGYEKIGESLSMNEGILSIARDATQEVVRLLNQAYETAALGTAANADFEKIQDEVQELDLQVTDIIASASFNGTNLLADAGGNIDVVTAVGRDASGDVVAGNITSVEVTNASLDNTNNVTGAINITSVADAEAALVTLDTRIQLAATAAADIGLALQRIESARDFNSLMSDAVKRSMGAIVDTNMEEASARLQALQVQQQLGVQALSIANQAPQTILSLFR